MKRRRFTLATVGVAIGGFFVRVRDAMATPPPVLFDPPVPKPKRPEHYIKVGRKYLMNGLRPVDMPPVTAVPWHENALSSFKIEQYPTHDRAAAEDFATAPSDYAVEAARIVHSRPPVEQPMCDGHNGPSPTRLTVVPDGRRLCEYCRKQHLEEQDAFRRS